MRLLRSIGGFGFFQSCHEALKELGSNSERVISWAFGNTRFLARVCQTSSPPPAAPPGDVNGADGPLQVLPFDQLWDCLADRSPAHEPQEHRTGSESLFTCFGGLRVQTSSGSQTLENSQREAGAGFRARGARGRCALRGSHRSSRGARFRGRRAAGGRPRRGWGIAAWLRVDPRSCEESPQTPV